MFPTFIQLLSLFLGLENPSLVRGGLPDRLAGLPLPAETQVVAVHICHDDPFAFAADVKLASPLDAGVFLMEMEGALEQHGWRRVRLPHPSFEPRLFQATDLPPPEPGLSGTPFFQKDGLTLLLPVPDDGPGGSSRVTLSVRRGDVPQIYLPPSNTDAGLMYDLFTQLAAPTGDELRSNFEAASGNIASGLATVTTRLSPADLAGHFTAQLIAVGWRVTERRSIEGSTVVRLEYRGGEKVYDARLSVSRPAGQICSNVDLEAALRTGE